MELMEFSHRRFGFRFKSVGGKERKDRKGKLGNQIVELLKEKENLKETEQINKLLLSTKYFINSSKKLLEKLKQNSIQLHLIAERLQFGDDKT